jgi:hypothetical protein
MDSKVGSFSFALGFNGSEKVHDYYSSFMDVENIWLFYIILYATACHLYFDTEEKANEHIISEAKHVGLHIQQMPDLLSRQSCIEFYREQSKHG